MLYLSHSITAAARAFLIIMEVNIFPAATLVLGVRNFGGMVGMGGRNRRPGERCHLFMLEHSADGDKECQL